MDGMSMESNTQEMNFEQYLLSTSTLDSLAPPTDDLSLSADFEAQIQAALRSTENTSFQNMTLAPTPSPSSSDNVFGNEFVSGSGSGPMVDSPNTEFSMNDWFSELTDDEASSMELLKVVLDDLGMSSFSPTSSSGLDKVNPVEYISPVALQSGMNGKEGGTVQGGRRSESPETVASFALRSNAGSGRGSPLSLSQSTSPSTESVNQYTFPTGSTAYSVLDSSSTSTSTNGLASGSGSGTYDNSTMDDLSTMFDIDMSSLDPLHQHRHHQSQSQSQGMARFQDGTGMNGQGERNMEAEGWMMGVLPFDMVDEGMVIA